MPFPYLPVNLATNEMKSFHSRVVFAQFAPLKNACIMAHNNIALDIMYHTNSCYSGSLWSALNSHLLQIHYLSSPSISKFFVKNQPNIWLCSITRTCLCCTAILLHSFRYILPLSILYWILAGHSTELKSAYLLYGKIIRILNKGGHIYFMMSFGIRLI